MIALLVSLLVLSTIIHCAYAIRVTKDWSNPVVIFSGIHLVHDWIQSFFYVFSEDFTITGVLIPISDDMVASNLLRNLIGQWCFFMVFVIYKSCRAGKFKEAGRWVLPASQSLIPVVVPYGLMTLLIFALSGMHGFAASGDQALTGVEAFDVVSGLFSIRLFFWMFALMISGGRLQFRFLICTLPLEIYLSGGSRKVLLMGLLAWLFSYFYAKLKQLKKAGVMMLFRKGVIMLLPAYFLLLFMSAKRDASFEETSISTALISEFNKISDSPQRVFLPLCATDSEAVQIWCSDLVSQSELPLMYGKTYFQAIINTVVLRPFQGDIANWQGAFTFKMTAYPTIVNMGWDFTFVAESILNWGNRGFFLSFIGFSLVFCWLYKKRGASLFWQNLYFLFIAVCFVSFRTDSTALLRFVSYFLAVCLYAKVFYPGKGSYVVSSHP